MNITELQKAIIEEKEKRNTFILAHTYQRPEILDIADLSGDSFALSKAAKNVPNKRVLLCGVRFMAETVKILSPEKEVVLSVDDAGCPMAEQIDPLVVKRYKDTHPTHVICSYVNTTAALKAVSDICVTSSTAVSIVEKIESTDILFLPDKNLGAYVQKMVPDKHIHLLDGYCPVHNLVTAQGILECKKKYPNAKVAIHPECPIEALEISDMVGSTKDIIQYAKSSSDEIILVTEKGVYDKLSKEYPNRIFHQLLPEKMVCADMKKTALTDVHRALMGEGGTEITIDEPLRLAAKSSIENMIKYGN